MDKYFKISFYISLIFFGLGQMGRVFIPAQPIYFYLYEIPFVISLFLLIIRYKFAPFDKNNKISTLTILFLGWLVISFIFPFAKYSLLENGIAFLYLLRLTSYLLFFIYFTHHFKEKNKQKILQVPILIFSIWIIFSSFVQYFLYPNIGNIAYLGWDPHLMRVVGVFLEPPLSVTIYFLIFIYFASLWFSQKKWYQAVLSVAGVILLLLTYSRGGLIGFGPVLILLSLKTKKILIGILLIVSLLILIFSLSNSKVESLNLLRTTSISSRIEDYQEGFDIWQKSPISGIGYNRIRFEKSKFVDMVFLEDYNPSHGITSFHSSFLTILVSTGVLGLLVYLTILFQIARKNFYWMSIVLFLSIVSIFDNVLLHPFTLFLFPLFLVSYPVHKSA